MVLIDRKVGDKDIKVYMDGRLYEQLEKFVKPSVQKEDFDYVLAIDGQEGSGKSVFAFQIAKILDPNFTLDNVCFTPNEFIKAVVKAKKYSCIVFDEAFTGLSSRASLSEINQLLVSLMMEMRQKNLFIIMVMPTFFMFDKYAVLHRAKGLFHVYMKEGKRGYWGFFNKQRMKYLYLKGKKFFSYSGTKFRMFGRFTKQYTINEASYRAKKRKELHRKRRRTRADTYKEQRDTCLYLLINDMKLGLRKTARLCTEKGFSITHATLSDINVEMRKKLLVDDPELEEK